MPFVSRLRLSHRGNPCAGIRHCILHHRKRHLKERGNAKIAAFLTHPAVEGRVSTSTQTQTLRALLFLDRQVFNLDRADIDAIQAKRPQYLPTVSVGTIAVIVGALIENARTLIENMGTLIENVGTFIRNTRAFIENMGTLIENVGTFIRNARTLIENLVLFKGKRLWFTLLLQLARSIG